MCVQVCGVCVARVYMCTCVCMCVCVCTCRFVLKYVCLSMCVYVCTGIRRKGKAVTVILTLE